MLTPILPTPNKVKTENLKKIWNEKKRVLDITQQTAAKQLGITQGAFSQYLNGHSELNEKATMKIAKFLGVHPEVIDPNFRDDVNIIKRESWSIVITSTASDSKTPIEVEYNNSYTSPSPDYFYVLVDKTIKVLNADDSVQCVLPKNAVLGMADITHPHFNKSPRCKPHLYAVKKSTRKSYSFLSSPTPPEKDSSVISIFRIILVAFP